MPKYYFLLLILFFTSFSQAQQMEMNWSRLSSFSTLFKQIKQNAPGSQQLPAQDLLSAVNPDEYMVDAGDEFTCWIDVEGPETKLFTVMVSADGMVLFPEAAPIHVAGDTLSVAKSKIINNLRRHYKTSKIQVSLTRLHKIHIQLIGALDPVPDLNLTSAHRLADVIQRVVGVYQSDTLKRKLLDRVSVRHVEIIRRQYKKDYDLLRFLRTGDVSHNPLIKDNDVIYVHFQDTLQGKIFIGGQVGYPGYYEYRRGDSGALLIQLAGGLLQTADSNRIELYRREKGNQKRSVFQFSQLSDLAILPGDQLLVRAKPIKQEQQQVLVQGEAVYPGFYPIVEGETRLSHLLQWIGGFSDLADVEQIFIKRKVDPTAWENDLKRIQKLNRQKIPLVENSYLAEMSRLKKGIVQVQIDPETKKLKQDILLRDGDVLVIPAKTFSVAVIGGVKRPGIYPFQQNATVQDYITLAGGYAPRAQTFYIKLIKGKSGAWLDVNGDAIPEPGDQIFVPKRNELEFWPLLKELVTVVNQIAWIYIILWK